MGLFQKRPIAGTALPIYSLGLTRTMVIIGLGNPGPEFDGTRHNIGFECLDHFATKNDFPGWLKQKDLQCLETKHTLSDCRVILIKPTTFMNLSGEAAQKVLNFYNLPLNQLVVVHDELDIDFGTIRVRQGGSSAGHNGLKSLIQHLGPDFGRLRIGIGPATPPQIKGADFVLKKFNADEQPHLTAIKKEVNVLLTEIIHSGIITSETRQVI